MFDITEDAAEEIQMLTKNLNQALDKIKELEREIARLEVELYNSHQFWPD